MEGIGDWEERDYILAPRLIWPIHSMGGGLEGLRAVLGRGAAGGKTTGTYASSACDMGSLRSYIHVLWDRAFQRSDQDGG